MNDLLSYAGNPSQFGPNWPAWIAAAGFLLFCLLGLYTALLVGLGKRMPPRLRFIELPTLRGRMALGFILAGTLPAISLALVLADRTADERLERTALILQTQTQNFAKFADYFLQKRVADLLALDGHFARDSLDDQPRAAELLQQFHRATPSFEMLMVADETGAVVAATRSRGSQVGKLQDADAGIASRDYFRRPLENGKSYFSKLLDDPALGSSPTAVLSIPLGASDGASFGVLIGSIGPADFKSMQNYLGIEKGIESILVDPNGRVISATESTGLNIFDDLTGESFLGVPQPRAGEIFNFQGSDAVFKSTNYLATHQVLKNGWRIFLVRSMDELELALFKDYGVALAWLAVTLLIAVCLARAIVNSVSGPLEALDESVRDFELSVNQTRRLPPANAPREVLTIFEHLRTLEKRLRATYRKLRRAVDHGEKLRGELIYVIANREKEIEKRTEELKEANDTLERLSREDSLTGLANRRWFAQFLTRTWQGAIRNKQPVCILIIDIDDFKAYNDHYGHQKGDSCLKIVSEGIRRVVGRASDLVSRYGGEEFVVVLGDTALDGGLQTAEKIRAAVENLGVPHKGAKNHRHVTVSIGVTSTLPAPDIQPATILVAADRAMYIAKNKGKNQVAYTTLVGTGVYQALCLPPNTELQPS